MKKEQGLPAFGGARGDQGFTLIELLVTVVILSILLGLAIPGFSRWLPNYRLRGAARDLYANLQLAKSGAIKERAEWAVRFVSGTNSYEVWSSGNNRAWDGYTAPDDTLVKTVILPDYGSGLKFGAGSATSAVPETGGGTITAVPATPIVLNSRGLTTNNTAVFAYMTNDKNTPYAVGTLASGVVILRKWNGTAWQ